MQTKPKTSYNISNEIILEIKNFCRDSCPESLANHILFKLLTSRFTLLFKRILSIITDWGTNGTAA